jgi:beta-glucosidase
LGNYNGILQRTVTPLMGIKDKLGSKVNIVYKKAIGYVKSLDNESIDDVVAAALSVGVIIYVGGISATLEGEDGDAGKEKIEGFLGGDRTIIALPKI